jgi:predicted nucleic acid-binding protein
MIALVNDANILIDLIKLELLEPFFSMPLAFHSTDLIIENELHDAQKAKLKPYIEKGKFTIQELDARDIMRVLEMRLEKPQLSDKDCSALYCAEKLNALLITSDKALRNFARQRNVDVHGHLWVFDALLQYDCITHGTAIDKLNELNNINIKLSLPKKECEARIDYWKKQV